MIYGDPLHGRALIPLLHFFQRYNPDHRGHFSSLRKILISLSVDSANFRFAISTSMLRLDFLPLDFRRSTSPPSRILVFPPALYTENSRSNSLISPTIFSQALVSLWIKTAKSMPFANLFNYQMVMIVKPWDEENKYIIYPFYFNRLTYGSARIPSGHQLLPVLYNCVVHE